MTPEMIIIRDDLLGIQNINAAINKIVERSTMFGTISETGNQVVIFATDRQDPIWVAQFQGLWRSHNPSGNLLAVIGSYKNESELSFMCNEEDFYNIVVPNGWVDTQECALFITRCNKQYSVLKYYNGETQGIGCMKSVPQEEALSKADWTFRPDINQWFICVKDNNDGRPPAEGWNADHIRVKKDAPKWWVNLQSGIHPVEYSEYEKERNKIMQSSGQWTLMVAVPVPE